MNQNDERIRELLEASIQIAEHMHEIGSAREQIEQIKQLLRQQADAISSNNEQHASSLRNSLVEVEQLIEELQQHEWQAYHAETDGNPAQFESQSLEDQLQQAQAYHEKIDYKSLEKIKDNLEHIRSM